jgi:hypothetical protein
LTGATGSIDAQVSAALTLAGTASDADGVQGLALSVSIPVGPAGHHASASLTPGTASGTSLPFTVSVQFPAGSPSGSYTVQVTATDTGGLLGSSTATLTVVDPHQLGMGFTSGSLWDFGTFKVSDGAIQTKNAVTLHNDLGEDARVLFNVGNGLMQQTDGDRTGVIPMVGHGHFVVSTGNDPLAPGAWVVAHDGSMVDLGTIPAGAAWNVWLAIDDLPTVIPAGQYGFTFGVGHAPAP